VNVRTPPMQAIVCGERNGKAMPIYEFECLACAERFDRLQKLTDPDPDSCPNCGATGVRRRLTAPSFRLAGSGWYETDFKKDGDKKRNLAEKADAAKGDDRPDASAKAEAPAVKSDAPAKAEPAVATKADKPKGEQKTPAAPAPKSPRKDASEDAG
jgi:putative FmdB family regulatory protein